MGTSGVSREPVARACRSRRLPSSPRWDESCDDWFLCVHRLGDTAGRCTSVRNPRSDRRCAGSAAGSAAVGSGPRDAAVLIVAVWLVAVIIFGIVEHLIDDQTFPTVWLGMWWALATVTTVGYGDVVPQDPVGRVVASFLLLGGLALISVLTATITSGFVARAQRETPSSAEVELLAEIRELRARVEELATGPER